MHKLQETDRFYFVLTVNSTFFLFSFYPWKMTKFVTYFNLCSIPEPKDFLGISPDKDENNIITTLGKNIIIIIKVSVQEVAKCLIMENINL